MIIGVIGSGGREHAICSKISKSKRVSKIYCFPGNAGTDLIATNVNIKVEEFEKIKEFVIKKNINLLVVGPEKPLVDGIVDYFQKNNIKIFGPEKIAAKLEGSKIFTKKICEEYNIPTAKFGVFKTIKEAKVYLNNCKFPIVVKADGLAAGKGVYICENTKSANEAMSEILNGKFGKAYNILIEEFLKGEEMSYFIVSDGTTIKKFQTAQDHKRALEGDKGKNTGGMGAYSPSTLINEALDKKIMNKIIVPTIKGLEKMGTKYKGFLYAGLMIVNNEPFLIEYNVRMGDPECQTILPKLKSDIVDIFLGCCENNLEKIKIEWHEEKSLCVVLCSKGYPDKFENNIELNNLDKLKIENNQLVFHAGTINKNSKIYSNGGRVLNFVVLSENFKSSRDKAIRLIKELNWKNGYYRKDIGFKVIK